MKLDLLIKNGTVVTAHGRYCGNIGVVDGKVAQILAHGDEPEATKVVDAAGKFIIPGGIDAHVHFEDPGRPDREDFAHGTAACAVGGITTPVIMPTNDPLILSVEALQTNLASWKDNAYVDYAVHGGLDANSLKDVRRLWEETGVVSIKVFMCYSSPNMGFVNDQTLFEAMEIMAEIGGRLIIHAENDDILKLYERRIHEAGRTDYMSFNESRPAFGEVEAVRRAIFFAKQTGCPITIPHVSTAQSLREIKEAKDQGYEVWAESCPQYFTWVAEDTAKYGAFLKFSPVMHEEDNRLEMWKLLERGYVDTIGSDHSPYDIKEKEAGKDNIWLAPNGVPGIENELACFLTAVNEGKIELEDVVRMTSYNPAKIYSLENKGKIEIGYDADIVLVDMDLEKVYSVEDTQALCQWSPYFGRTYKGWPVMTICRGNVVAENGKILGEPTFGKLISRVK